MMFLELVFLKILLFEEGLGNDLSLSKSLKSALLKIVSKLILLSLTNKELFSFK